MSFIFQVSHRKKTSLMELGNVCAGAAVFFGLAYWLVFDAFDRMSTSYVTVGLSAYYTAPRLVASDPQAPGPGA